MQSVMLMVVGVACLLVSGFVFLKLAPKDGEPAAPWLQKESMAMAVSLALIMVGTFGVGLMIKGLAG